MRLSVNDRHNIISNSQLYIEDKLVDMIMEFISVYGYERYVLDYDWICKTIINHLQNEIDRYNYPISDVVNVNNPITGYRLN